LGAISLHFYVIVTPNVSRLDTFQYILDIFHNPRRDVFQAWNRPGSGAEWMFFKVFRIGFIKEGDIYHKYPFEEHFGLICFVFT
jgi:hypothetical protein